MKLSLWRPGILSWFSNLVHVDSYELREPLLPGTNTCFIEALRNVTYSNEGQPVGRGDQHIYLLLRYPSELMYYQLPLAELEGVHSSVSQRLLLDSSSIAPILTLELPENNTPVRVSELGENRGEWLIELHWVFSISWLAELETNYQYDPSITINSVSGSLWRQSIYIQERNKDTEWSVHYDPLVDSDGNYLVAGDSSLVI